MNYTTIDNPELYDCAVASQKLIEITGHTGRCRKFWIYEIENGTIANKVLLELFYKKILLSYVESELERYQALLKESAIQFLFGH